MKHAKFIEHLIRTIAVAVALGLIVTGSGCSQMFQRQRDDIAERIGEQVRYEVAEQSQQSHDEILDQLRGEVSQNIDTGISQAVTAARSEAAEQIRQAGVDPEELRAALYDVAKERGIDAESVVANANVKLRGELVAYTNGQIDALDGKLDQASEELGTRAENAVRTAVAANIETFEERTTAAVEQASSNAVTGGLITGGTGAGAVAIALGVVQWLVNRRRKRVAPVV